jgi:arginine utilization protein RocB
MKVIAGAGLLSQYTPAPTMSSQSRVKHFTLELMRQPSVTESDGESAFAAHLAQVLRTIPYFQANPDYIRVIPTRDDFRSRANVFALVKRGASRKTVVMAGHYDVVSTANYGPLEPYAHDPEALLPRLIAVLEHEQRDAAAQEALADLRSGDYLPGRGVLDMKSGDAIGIATLERFAMSPDANGNMLFICTPDEENYSHGMRSAIRDLPTLLLEWGLEPALVVNLDSSGLVPDGAQEVFMGSVAKYMPFVLFVGRPTHAGDPFGGVSASLLAAELVREVECNPAYSDAQPAQGELPPMPVALRSVDLKRYYDVTTPEYAFTAFNMLSFSSTAADVLGRIADGAQRALYAAVATMRQRALDVAQPFGISGAGVFRYDEVLAAARVTHPQIDAEIDALAEDRALDVLTMSERAVQLVARAAALPGPAAIVGFAPLHYPLSSVVADERFGVIRRVRDAAQRAGASVLFRPFFTGISDMSFLGAQADADALRLLGANTPGWRQRWNLTGASGLSVPALNIGPSGRDYHQRYERVHMPLSFEVAPALVWELLYETLLES